MRSLAESAVRLANRKVPIELACSLAGESVIGLADQVRSLKIRCPFGELYHDDGGAEPALRVYPGPNNAWCFACGEFFTPVSICAKAWDVQPEAAAIQLLDRIGYKPASYAHHWREVTAPVPPDGHALAQALKFACERMEPDWGNRQAEPLIAEYLARCLGLIPSITSQEDADAWLSTARQVMEGVLLTTKGR